MATYLTPKRVRNKETREAYVPGKEFEMNVDRAKEFEENIKQYKGYEDFQLERVDTPKKKTEEPEEEVTEAEKPAKVDEKETKGK